MSQGRPHPSLSVDPHAAPLRPGSPYNNPASAIISVPPDWNSDSASGSEGAGPSTWTRTRSSMDSQPMSTSSSSSSLNPIFSWPPPDPTTSGARSHSTDRYSNISDDPLHPSSSSSSDEDLDPTASSSLSHQHPMDGRRGSVVFIPHALRSITDPHLAPPVDSELSGAHQEEYDFPPENGPPRFTRTFSAPLPNRVGYLRHPHSPLVDPSPTLFSDDVPPRPPSRPYDSSSSSTIADIATPLSTLSLELADSLQSAIQTLLHLSPPHLLDNAKEQYSGCTVQMPTTSLSALLTSMKSLNYLSANVQGLCEALGGKQDEGLLASSRKTADFDIGELAQNVADLLGGQAAQAGVDLVLFHGDVGIKHVSVNGDSEGLGYTLSHIIRQILQVARKGDIIEIGLQLVPQSPSLTPKVALPLSATDVDVTRKRDTGLGETLSPAPSKGADGPMLCVFEIIHNIAQQSPDSSVVTPKAEINPFKNLVEVHEAAIPKLDTILCRRLLDQQRASLKKDVQPSSPLGSGMPRRAYELSVLLPRGLPLVEPVALSVEEEAVRQPFTGVKLAREPTLPELSDFVESLRGKKVSLHASLSSLFARHLTSYLGAWGLDISHIPIEEEEAAPVNARHDSGYGGSLGSTPASEMVSGIQSLTLGPKDTDRFIIVDDDVVILRRELLKMCADSNQLKPRLLKRPTLGARARSTPQIRPMTTTKTKTPVLIHFTSLANYNSVRDVIASVFGPQWSSRDGAFHHPEVMVIPKPVGPRRFLTALHTAVNQPLVDPTFSPIATTPRSPGGGYFWTGGRTPLGNEAPREGFFDSVAEEMAERSSNGSQKAKSPLVEHPPTGEHLHPAHEVVSTPATEYFSAASRNSSGASGVIIQSPDGRFGIHFDPPTRGERRSSYSQRAPNESLSRKPTSRRTSGVVQESISTNASPTTSPQSARRQSAMTNGSDQSASRRSSLREEAQSDRRRKTLPSAPEPLVVQGRQRSSTITQRVKPGSPSTAAPATSPSLAGPKKKVKEEVVVPPINVLIVEDNPINQNILSMFLRKKKIKHQAAKDGQEAIEKWRTGGFHLILMDIQLPVMDGITATRHIRAEEKKNNIGVYPSTPLGEVSRQLESVPSSPLRSSVIIVALTASSLHSDRVAALGAGCNDFLTKPVSLKWLEKKIVEWGCMQALIDFDGWKRWKGAGPDGGETKRGFQFGPQQAARGVADRLRIERKAGRSPARKPESQTSQAETAPPLSLDINVSAPTPPLQPADATSPPTPAQSLDAARKTFEDNHETLIQPTHPDVTAEVASTPTPLGSIGE